MSINALFPWLVAAAVLVVSFAAAGRALLYKRDPLESWSWIVACLAFPPLGAILFFFFGINRVRTKAREIEDQARFPHPDRPRPERPPSSAITRHLGAEHYQFQLHDEAIHRLTGLPARPGNHITPLINGNEAYPAMIQAIRDARIRIMLSTYIFEKNYSGRLFVEALADARQRGVEVLVLLDGVGQLHGFSSVYKKLKRVGINVQRFLPPRLFPPTLTLNLCNHRKILVSDRTKAFIGGINIGDRYMDDGTNPNRALDIHFMIEGPVIDQIAQVFTDDWQFATHSKLRPPARRMHRPVLPAGKAWCRAVADGPNDDLDALATLLVSAVHTARKRVVIMTPYFLPSRELILALQTASLRGVEVIVLLPGKPDNPIVHWATRHMLWQLLRHNVQVLYQPAPFVHSKLFLVDGQYALIGSTNIDPRSLRLNFELGLEIFDSQTVKPLGQYCQRAYKASTQISLASLENRRLPERIRDAIAWLFSPYL